jgi:hypothetical protein
LFGKLDELKHRLSNDDVGVDIAVITESWPKNMRFAPTEAELSIKGYDLHCTEIGKGRGICIYTKTSLNAQYLSLDSQFCEHLIVVISLRGGDKLQYIEAQRQMITTICY